MGIHKTSTLENSLFLRTADVGFGNTHTLGMVQVLDMIRRADGTGLIDVVAYRYIASCLMCASPLRIEELQRLSGKSRVQVRLAIFEAVTSLVPARTLALEHARPLRKHILTHSETVSCVYLRYDKDTVVVRKRIMHDGDLPAYDAMIEVVVHYLLDARTTHVAPLLYAKITSTHLDLYYEYIPYPLYTYFGTNDRALVCSLTRELLLGVQSMHQYNIAHRDLKGPNIHVRADGTCMILDVGSAGYGVTRRTVPITTISHRSPEILQAELRNEQYDYDSFKLDIWSLGVLVLELCFGENPFGDISMDMDAHQMLQQIQQSMPRILHALGVRWTSIDSRVLGMCLHEDPAVRPDINTLLQHLTPEH